MRRALSISIRSAESFSAAASAGPLGDATAALAHVSTPELALRATALSALRLPGGPEAASAALRFSTTSRPAAAVASRLVAGRLIGGADLDAALAVAARLEAQNVGVIVDHSVEDAGDAAVAAARAHKRALVVAVGSRSRDALVPVKPTAVMGASLLEALGAAIAAAPDPDAVLDALSEDDRAAHADAAEYLAALARDAEAHGAAVLLDAEVAALQPAVDHLFLAALRRPAYMAPTTYVAKAVRDAPALYNTYQCYLVGSERRLALDAAAAADAGAAFGAKLVRGAYLDDARAAGALRESKDATDDAYDAAVAACLDAVAKGERRYALLCTHNAASAARAVEGLDARCLKRDDARVAFAQILGLGDALTGALAAAGCRARKLVLFGALDDLAPWLARRLDENADALGAPAAEAPLLWAEVKRRLVG